MFDQNNHSQGSSLIDIYIYIYIYKNMHSIKTICILSIISKQKNQENYVWNQENYVFPLENQKELCIHQENKKNVLNQENKKICNQSRNQKNYVFNQENKQI